MLIAILHNRDHDVLEDDPGREAREDVLRVAAALSAALQGGKRRVELFSVDRDLTAVTQELSQKRPAVVLNLCESLHADSRGEMIVPAILDLLGLPYTGSPALSLGLSLHKDKAKQILAGRGVPTPEFRVVRSLEELWNVDLEYPLIVKPAREDASIGIDFDSVVHDKAALGRAVAKVLHTFHQPALVERYIEGREIYVPLLGNNPRRSLPLTEIHYGRAFENRPKILSYRAKWEPSSAESLDSPAKPATLSPVEEAACIKTALAAFDALDCRDYGRVDLRLSNDGTPYVIDINPNCDLHPQSGFAKAASAAGIGYEDLALHLVELARERTHGYSTPAAERSTPTRRAPKPHRNVLTDRSAVRTRAHRPGVPAKPS